MNNNNSHDIKLLTAIEQAQAIAECGHLDEAINYLDTTRNAYASYCMTQNIEFTPKVWNKAENQAYKLLMLA